MRTACITCFGWAFSVSSYYNIVVTGHVLTVLAECFVACQQQARFRKATNLPEVTDLLYSPTCVETHTFTNREHSRSISFMQRDYG